MLNLTMVMKNRGANFGSPIGKRDATVTTLARLTARGRIPARRFGSLGLNWDLRERPLTVSAEPSAFRAGI